MKRLILILFLGFLFLSVNPSSASASLIFQDSFQGGINKNEWSIVNLANDGAYFNNSSFGIQDASAGGKYTILDSVTSNFTNDNEVSVDVKVNNNDPSTFALFCRGNQDNGFNTGFGAQFYNGNIFNGFGANTFDSAGAIDAVGFNWDRSNGIHHFDVTCDNSHITVQEDGNYLYNDPSHNYIVDTANFVSLSFGDGHTSEFANFQMCDLNGCSSPTPTPIQLSVPVIKQAGQNAPWQNLTYDLATIWSPHNYTIGTWGCALTSATMVLNYYNIHKIPNSNLDMNPGNLDAWLGLQPDGYVPNGNVNWLAISRLTKGAQSNNPNFKFDGLEYKRSNFTDTTILLADLQNGQPDILEEPGHFVVATGQSGSTYTINDPYFNRYPRPFALAH